MKKIFSIFIIFNLFIGCSFIESKSFYETFINPNFDIEINDDDKGQAPDLESVPGSN
jgi:hypothetical protein|tara:strand:+ start:1227 stop:1397 length:171 start_codon:yes stop_codon:yes gene_type:complete